MMKNFMLGSISKTLIIVGLGLATLPAQASSNNITPPAALKERMSALGNVKEIQETSTKGMFAWVLEKNGRTLVLYNTPDNKHFIKGTIYDIDTKQVVSDKHALSSLKYASPEFKKKILAASGAIPVPTASSTSPQQQALSVGYMNLKWGKSDIPDALKLVDSMAGVKEGKGKPQDTLYILYDPNCIWCHRSYSSLRSYVAKGYTIKWLPTVALGRTTTSLALASAPLQKNNMLQASFDKTLEAKKTIPSEKNIADINQNMQFLSAYFKKAIPDQKPSVPLALFLDKSTGKVTHLQGLSDKPVHDLLFGE